MILREYYPVFFLVQKHELSTPSRINQLVDDQHTFHDRIYAIEGLSTGFVRAREMDIPSENARQEEMTAWTSRWSKEALGALDFVEKEDGYCLASLTLSNIVSIPEQV